MPQVYPRFIEARLREALADTPVVAINGPRQSGKTTLARKLAAPGWRYLSMDDASMLEAAQRDPVGFVRDLDRAVVDEVQRAPDLLLAIKRSVDDDRRPGRFLLTGSAHILTVPRIKESLAGRMEIVSLYPLSRSEVLGRHRPTFLERAFEGRVAKTSETLIGNDLMEVVLAGGYPEVLARNTERRRRDWCRAYVDAIVERDIRDIADVEKIGRMPRLLEVLAQFSGQLINVADIGARLGIDQKTARRYIAILEQLFLVETVRPWFRNELKRLVKTPKLHFLDAGLLGVLQRQTLDKLTADRSAFGAILESFVYGELLKQSSWAEEQVSLFHYRDKDQHEVDFVLEGDAGRIVGVEVKAAATIRATDFRGLEKLSAASRRAFALGVVLYDGSEMIPFGDRLFAAPIACLWS